MALRKRTGSPLQAVLFTDGNPTGSTTEWPGGRTNVEISGSFFGAKAYLERKASEAEWRPVKEAGVFVEPVFRVVGRLPKGSYRVKVAGGSQRTKLKLILMRMRA